MIPIQQSFVPCSLPCFAVGMSNGAYDAFAVALDEILAAKTDASRPKLVDYQIHIPRGGKTNALTEAAITWKMAKN